MKKQVLHFDRSYWPDCEKVPVSEIKINLSDLWKTRENELSVLVAESLISEEMDINIDMLNPQSPIIKVNIWEVGGDTLVLEAPLFDSLRFGTRFLNGGDKRTTLRNLEKLEALILDLKDELKK